MEQKQAICDTDVVIDYLDRKNIRYDATKAIIEGVIGTEHICISAITKMELIQGSKDKIELGKINKSIQRFSIATIDYSITNKAIELIQTYSLSHSLAIPDGLIAATAIQLGWELFTYNTKRIQIYSRACSFQILASRHCCYQPFGIFIYRVLQHLLRVTAFHYFACLHYHYPVADVVYYGEVVGYEEIGEVELLSQVFEQVEYLGLYAYVQRRYAFIAYQ